LKVLVSILKEARKMTPFFPPLYRFIDFLYSLGLEFVASHVHVRKHVKLYINIYALIFCISSFLPRYLCIITYACEKTSPSCNYHNLNYPKFSLKFIPCKFYIWKITKTKFLKLVFKKGALIMNMPIYVCVNNNSCTCRYGNA
jgi:hypothetical protein